MVDYPSFSDLAEMKKRAEGFIAFVAQQFATKDATIAARDAQIADLQADVRKAVAAIDDVLSFKSDYALLKDRTVNQAKSVRDEIAAKLPPEQQS